MQENIAWFLLAFIFLWIGSGLAVRAITSISHHLRMSSFILSFFVLGFFTSISEITVGITAVINNQPEIYVGNMIGGSTILFLLVIPLLAVVGNGVSLNHSFNFKDLVSSVIVVGLPAALTLDNQISMIDAVLCVSAWSYFVFTIEKESGSLDKIVHINMRQSSLVTNSLHILAGLFLVFAASNILVQHTAKLGEALRISPYIISVLIISIGTNIPEISIAVRSILLKNKGVAFGNYVGSATLNTLEMGVLSFLTKTPVTANGSNFSILMFILGLLFFIHFVKSRSTISRKEGLMLLSFYLFFVICEVFTGPGWNLFGQ